MHARAGVGCTQLRLTFTDRSAGDLSRVAWLKWAVLANPVVYMTEGFRAALVGNIPHMPLYAIYGALVAFGALFTWIGVTGFEKRVVS